MNDDLSPPAQLALRSLRDEPNLTTPRAIANGPFSIEQIDTPDVQAGLVELQGRGLARETRPGEWELTDAGRRTP